MPPNSQQPVTTPPPNDAPPIGKSAPVAYPAAPPATPAPPSIPQTPAEVAAEQQRQQQTKQASNQTTTQKSLLFSELRDGIIIMTDGSFRAIVACQSINFDLMSSREREGIEFSYQNFLNSLVFPIQVLVRSQRVDIAPYLERLDNIRRSQDNMLLNVLMEDYLDFVDALAENANIMDKSFYIIIPYHPEGDTAKLVEQSKGFFSRILGGGNAPAVTRIDKGTYDKAQSELGNRVESVIGGLFQVGIQAARLSTKELGELYYNVYNPDTSVNQPLTDFNTTTTTFVRKGQGQAPSRQGEQL